MGSCVLATGHKSGRHQDDSGLKNHYPGADGKLIDSIVHRYNAVESI